MTKHETIEAASCALHTTLGRAGVLTAMLHRGDAGGVLQLNERALLDEWMHQLVADAIEQAMDFEMEYSGALKSKNGGSHE